MRFRNSQPALHATVLLLVATYVLYLGSRGQLSLYIHPRYIIFTITLAGIGLIITIADILYSKNHRAKHKHAESKVILLPLLFLILAAVALPARTLSSSTVTQRTTDSGSIVATTEKRNSGASFTGSSRALQLRDWAQLLEANSDPSYYQNKPAKISGFLYDAELGKDTVWIARFVLTCCAVDAQPVSLPLQIVNWQADYREDEWLEVEGEFRLEDTSNGQQLVLVPIQINRIEQPENPYAN